MKTDRIIIKSEKTMPVFVADKDGKIKINANPIKDDQAQTVHEDEYVDVRWVDDVVQVMIRKRRPGEGRAGPGNPPPITETEFAKAEKEALAQG